MNVSKLRKFVVDRYMNPKTRRRSHLFLGPPGIGKSIAVYEAAKEISKRVGKTLLTFRLRWRNGRFVVADDEKTIHEVMNHADDYFVLVDIRLSTVEPADLMGIPRSTEAISLYNPMAWAALLSVSNGIAFFDEFTQINRPDVESSSYPLILDKLAGFVEFGRGVMVIAAGNTPEHSSIAHYISTPLASRFKIVRIDAPRVDDWRDWMLQKHKQDWDTRVYAFLKAFEDEGYFIQVPKKPETLEPYPVPRTYEWLAEELKEGFDSPDDIESLIGYEVGKRFEAFLKTKVDINDLIENPDKFTTLPMDGKYMVAVMLGSWLSKRSPKQFADSFPLVDAMSSESMEYVTLGLVTTTQKKLVEYLKQLFSYNKRYEEALSEIAIMLKEAIEV